MIRVTKTFLPPYHEYEKYLKQIWENNIVTNNGPFCKELEKRLETYLGVPNVILVSSGTIALQIAMKALELKEEVITTPFSYVATTSSIHWEGLQAVFADIETEYLTINPEEVRKRITPKTSAILATHVFGHPCNHEKLHEIAEHHELKLIYDAAHAFGVKQGGESILNWGDCSTLSFHATKLFHTIEGGAIICKDDKLAHKLRYMRNFGHSGQDNFEGLGINGKMSEFQAAMGLCNLEYVNKNIEARQKLCAHYDSLLQDNNLRFTTHSERTYHNYSYYPVLFPNEDILNRVIQRLQDGAIEPRRYFYPSLNKLPYVQNNQCHFSEGLSVRILCLPLYIGLSTSTIDKICNIIHTEVNRIHKTIDSKTC